MNDFLSHLRLLHERDPAHGLRVRVLYLDVEGEPVLTEGEEPQAQLVTGLGHWHQVAAELDKVRLALQDLETMIQVQSCDQVN